MTFNVVLVAHNKELLKEAKQFIDQLDNITILHQGVESKSALEEISRGQTNLLIVVDKPKDSLVSEFILYAIEKRPTPTLILLSPNRSKAQYRGYINIPLIDVLEINTSNSFFIKQLSIQINILCKLKLPKFERQIPRIGDALRKLSILERRRENQSDDAEDEFIEDEEIESHFTSFVAKRRKKLQPPEPGVHIISDETAAKIDYSKIIVIGASTGGPGTITEILNGLPHVFPPVLVVQHMPRGFMSSFVERLNHFSRLRVKLAQDGDKITRNTIFVAQGGRHLELEQVGTNLIKIRITDGALVNFVKPAVDVTLFSAARLYGKNTISVILTGMGYDGREGSRTVKKLGGRVIAQNEESCVVYGMNKGIIEANLADTIADLSVIPKILIKEVTKQNGSSLYDEV